MGGSMASMKASQMFTALAFLQERLDALYGGSACVTIGKDMTILSVKGDDGISHHCEGLQQICEMLVPTSRQQKLEQDQAMQIYHEYPRKRDVHAARLAIIRALRDEEISTPPGMRFKFLLLATQLYARYIRDQKVEPQFIPYPATWFNRKSYLNAQQMVVQMLLNPNSAAHSVATKQQQTDWVSYAKSIKKEYPPPSIVA